MDTNTSLLDATNNLTQLSDEIKGKQTFTQKIRLPESLNLKNSIFQFIRKMQLGNLEERDIVMKTQQKILQVEREFQSLFDETDSQIIQENYEVIERILTKALYAQLLKGCRVKYDRKIEFYCRLYDFIQPIQFQVDKAIVNHQNFQKAKQQIQNIDACQTPKDKINCIVNACKLMSSTLASQSKNNPTGIDDLLPVMLYLVIQSLPARPLTNIQYIQELRSDKYLLSEEYYLTLYSSVMELIENLQFSDLKEITEKQYNEQIKANYKKYAEFLDAVDKEEEEIKKQEIFKTVSQLQSQLKDFNERLKILEQNKLKFASFPYQQMTLGDLQEFYNEYHIIHKHILDSQLELQKNLKFVNKFIVSKTNPNGIQKIQQEDNSRQSQNNSKQQGLLSFF
ncbi:vacuolar sorting protein 9, VPS9 domain protein (macronuclear) [Tetrahymena thermophila SB210]|uniref:Vacuolar sorting protein 9, VPS9 domain protein n=1 Tax=Tetrahymena thermophila (strain SB210) TaxID=312017 RepID=Q245D3_TETTS|nr:vacuolar sorting protein 9, VPS9 domain protein [Tetrahymena thermophila SB210]EAS03431.2 vacuolar sorting protein 9, VPS9 domain protein [Tetrahymena thermophila SB210]|eukprot:XP_001023676.2 vacuolar sorting protein 9, VPS9 domain protein [Tetrahymena thermophila SB210]